MGLDGGSIPSRTDLLRRASWRLTNSHANNRSTRGGSIDNCGQIQEGLTAQQKQEVSRLRWRLCAISGELLREPIVACEMGRIYNRESVIGSGQYEVKKEELLKNGFGHLTSMKKTFELHLKKTSAFDSKTKSTVVSDTSTEEPSLFVCPISGVETNGRHQFIALRTCGHVFGEKSFEHAKVSDPSQEKGKQLCTLCNVSYTKDDMIALNSIADEVLEDLKERMKKREKEEKEKKKKKKNKKRKGADSNDKEGKKAKNSDGEKVDTK